MPARLAFIRGINVGGRNTVPMADLRTALTDRGFDNVRTYIQSGNVVYDAPGRAGDTAAALRKEAATISSAIDSMCGFAPGVMVRTASDVAAAFAASPYRDEDPAKAFMTFVDGDAARLGDLDAVASGGERWELGDGVVHLFFPDGIGRSKLGGRLAAATNPPATTRNLRTIAKLLQLAGS